MVQLALGAQGAIPTSSFFSEVRHKCGGVTEIFCRVTDEPEDAVADADAVDGAVVVVVGADRRFSEVERGSTVALKLRVEIIKHKGAQRLKSLSELVGIVAPQR